MRTQTVELMAVHKLVFKTAAPASGLAAYGSPPLNPFLHQADRVANAEIPIGAGAVDRVAICAVAPGLLLARAGQVVQMLVEAAGLHGCRAVRYV